MRPIDADECEKYFYDHMTDAAMVGAMNAIDEMPTIDAVPVVRCKDCKWFGDIGCAMRIVDDSDKPTENDFCSFAERSEE